MQYVQTLRSQLSPQHASTFSSPGYPFPSSWLRPKLLWLTSGHISGSGVQYCNFWAGLELEVTSEGCGQWHKIGFLLSHNFHIPYFIKERPTKFLNTLLAMIQLNYIFPHPKSLIVSPTQILYPSGCCKCNTGITIWGMHPVDFPWGDVSSRCPWHHSTQRSTKSYENAVITNRKVSHTLQELHQWCISVYKPL